MQGNIAPYKDYSSTTEKDKVPNKKFKNFLVKMINDLNKKQTHIYTHIHIYIYMYMHIHRLILAE